MLCVCVRARVSRSGDAKMWASLQSNYQCLVFKPVIDPTWLTLCFLSTYCTCFPSTCTHRLITASLPASSKAAGELAQQCLNKESSSRWKLMRIVTTVITATAVVQPSHNDH